MKESKFIKGMVLSFDQEDEAEGIPFVPAWKWMLTN
jgi:predicted AAA+ superfamily ATPase